MIALLDKLEEWINKLVSCFLTPCFFLLAGISFAQVMARYVFKFSLPWSEELCRYIFIYATYLGSIIGVSRNTHIDITAIDLLLDKMTPEKRARANTILEIIVSLISLTVLGWITYLSIPYIQGLMKFGQRTPALGIGLYIPVLSVPIGMGLMCLLYVKRFLKAVLTLKGGTPRD